jgi:hypothetical protein
MPRYLLITADFLRDAAQARDIEDIELHWDTGAVTAQAKRLDAAVVKWIQSDVYPKPSETFEALEYVTKDRAIPAKPDEYYPVLVKHCESYGLDAAYLEQTYGGRPVDHKLAAVTRDFAQKVIPEISQASEVCKTGGVYAFAYVERLPCVIFIALEDEGNVRFDHKEQLAEAYRPDVQETKRQQKATAAWRTAMKDPVARQAVLTNAKAQWQDQFATPLLQQFGVEADSESGQTLRQVYFTVWSAIMETLHGFSQKMGVEAFNESMANLSAAVANYAFAAAESTAGTTYNLTSDEKHPDYKKQQGLREGLTAITQTYQTFVTQNGFKQGFNIKQIVDYAVPMAAKVSKQGLDKLMSTWQKEQPAAATPQAAKPAATPPPVPQQAQKPAAQPPPVPQQARASVKVASSCFITKKLRWGKGYSGKSGNRCWVAEITGTQGSGLAHTFLDATEVKKEHFNRPRTIIHFTYELPPGLYELSEDGDRWFNLVWDAGGTCKFSTPPRDRAVAIAKLMDGGSSFEEARLATKPAPATPNGTPPTSQPTQASVKKVGLSGAEKKAWELGQQYGRDNKPDLLAKDSRELYQAARRAGCPLGFEDVFKYGAQDAWRKSGQLQEATKRRASVKRQASTARVYFSDYAKIALVEVTPEVQKVLFDLYQESGVFYCNTRSAHDLLSQHILKSTKVTLPPRDTAVARKPAQSKPTVNRAMVARKMARKTEADFSGSFLKQRKPTKKQQQADAAVDAALVDMLLEFGAKTRPLGYTSYEYVLDTPVGELECHVRGGNLFTRFAESERAAAVVSSNQYSGKWNHYVSKDSPEITKHGLQKIKQMFNRLMAAPKTAALLPNEPSKTNLKRPVTCEDVLGDGVTQDKGFCKGLSKKSKEKKAAMQQETTMKRRSALPVVDFDEPLIRDQEIPSAMRYHQGPARPQASRGGVDLSSWLGDMSVRDFESPADIRDYFSPESLDIMFGPGAWNEQDAQAARADVMRQWRGTRGVSASRKAALPRSPIPRMPGLPAYKIPRRTPVEPDLEPEAEDILPLPPAPPALPPYKKPARQKGFVPRPRLPQRGAAFADASDAAEELKLYLDNDSSLYDLLHTKYYKILVAKVDQDRYNPALAAKLMLYYVERAAKKYIKEVSPEVTGGRPWNQYFPMAARQQVAKELVQEFEAYANPEEGSSDRFEPEFWNKLRHKKYQDVPFEEKFRSLRPRGAATTRSAGPDDVEVRELKLFAENDQQVYRQQMAVYQNLVHKLDAGDYDSELAIRGFQHTADLAAKRYQQEFGVPGEPIFSVSVRREVARQMRDEFEQNIETGEYDLAPMKHKKHQTVDTREQLRGIRNRPRGASARHAGGMSGEGDLRRCKACGTPFPDDGNDRSFCSVNCEKNYYGEGADLFDENGLYIPHQPQNKPRSLRRPRGAAVRRAREQGHYYENMPGAKYVLALGPEELELLFSLHGGQGDDVYAVASRVHGLGMSWVTEDELATVLNRLDEFLNGKYGEAEEKDLETASSLHYELTNLQNGSGIEYPEGIIQEFDLPLPPA